jgi:hypothetical protein
MRINKNNQIRKIREIIANPLTFRECGDKTLKKLLIEVRC